MDMADIGKIEVVTGCMFSGKTEELVRRLKRAMIAKQDTVAFKPVVDDRYSDEDIVSHGGVTLTAKRISDAGQILELVKDAQVVGIDEVQFFGEDLLEAVHRLARDGKRVICAGLDMDYRGIPFGIMPQLLAICDEPTKFQAVCTTCGRRAVRTQRIADSDEQVLVGGKSVYEARCRDHWSPRPSFSSQRRMDHLED